MSWSEPTSRGRQAAPETELSGAVRSRETRAPQRQDDLERRNDLDERHGRRLERGRAASGLPERRISGPVDRDDRDDLDNRHAARAERARTAGARRTEAFLDDDVWAPDLEAREPIIDYTDAVDEEQIWGPRPKLFPSEPGGRRTVVITGRGAERHPAARGDGRRSERQLEGRGSLGMQLRHGFTADRTAMWAVLLCVIVLLVALGSH